MNINYSSVESCSEDNRGSTLNGMCYVLNIKQRYDGRDQMRYISLLRLDVDSTV